MTSTLFQPRNSKTPAFGKNHRLLNVVHVQFQINHLKHDADARELQLHIGDQVIVSTERGPVIAEICGHVQRRIVEKGELPRVLRKANSNDIDQARRNDEIETQAYRFAIERIRARKLKMKLIRTQCMQDGSKLVFFFSADGRIDFRDLVKDLAHRFRTRIEMHQIGVRDGTRMLGGIGPCGRELCCSTFLENFEPISIRMAKDQGLTLNPRKISGMCGRLMCCLVYEQKLYRRMRTRLPRSGSKVQTENGKGTIHSVDVINQSVTVSFPDDQRQVLAIDEIKVINPERVDKKVDSKEHGDDQKILTEDSSEQRSSKRKRRRRKETSESPDSD